MREARAEWVKRLEARAGTERLAETRGLSKPLACGYEVHADARKTRRQPGGPPEKGTATALCPRRLLNVSLVLFYCSACPLRCRGGPNGGGGQEGFGILLLDRLADKKPQTRSTRCRVFRMPASDCSFVLGLRPADFGACVFFVFRLADMREWAGNRRSIPRKIMPPVCSPTALIPSAISSLGCHTSLVSPPGFREGFGVIL